MRSAAKTCAWITSTSGIKVAAAAPTQSANVETSSSMPSRAKVSLCRLSGRCRPYLQNRTWASSLGPARPRAIGCEGAGGCVIASQVRQESFSRTCWITFHWRGTSSSVSVTSSPILRKEAPPQHGQAVGSGLDDPFARQLLRQGPARRLPPLERRHLYPVARRGHPGCRLRLRGILLQIGQLKLELIQQCAAFRGLAEPLVPQLPDRVFELLDQQRAVLRFTFRSEARRTLGNEHRLQRLDIIRQRISGAHRP